MDSIILELQNQAQPTYQVNYKKYSHAFPLLPLVFPKTVQRIFELQSHCFFQKRLVFIQDKNSVTNQGSIREAEVVLNRDYYQK